VIDSHPNEMYIERLEDSPQLSGPEWATSASAGISVMHTSSKGRKAYDQAVLRMFKGLAIAWAASRSGPSDMGARLH
jgi:hypothetical protein